MSGRTITNNYKVASIESETAIIGELTVTGRSTEANPAFTGVPVYTIPAVYDLSLGVNYTTSTFPVAALLPTYGGIIRSPTGGWSDVLPATTVIIDAVAAVLPGSVWNINQYYDIYLNNASTGTWTLTQGDANTIMQPGSAGVFTTITIFTSASRRAFFRLIRLSSTQILLTSIGRS